MGGWEVLLESLLLVFALAMFVGKLFEELVVRIGLPPVLGDLIAGLILGSSFLAVYPVNDFIIAFSWLGIAFLLLYAGLETRYREFMRSIGLYGFITIGEGLAAFGMGFLVGAFFGYPIRSAYFIG
ncbi:MAG: sodium:proton exchanger, partial [Desulfurococcales archaeon ex4484_58]